MTSDIKHAVIRNPSWWKRRTSMERCLTVVSAIIFLAVITLVIALVIVLCCLRKEKVKDVPFGFDALQGNHGPAIVNAYPEHNHHQDLCLTPGCIHTASRILDNMDPTVEPCDDFYQFACGNFIKETIIPDDKTQVNSFTLIADTVQEQLRIIIEEPLYPKEPRPFVLLKKLYKTCLNKVSAKRDGLITMKSIIKKLGGWPVLEGSNWDDGNFDWQQTVYNFRKYGYSVNYLIDFSVDKDMKNNTKRLIVLDQGALSLDREFLLKGLEDKLIKAYYDYMVDIAVIFGGDRKVAEKELKDSLHFEIKLANFSLPSEKRRNATLLYNPLSICDLQAKFHTIPWLEYINTILNLSDIRVGVDDVVVVSDPSYLQELEKVLTLTPKRTIGNYLMWRAVESSVSYLTEELKNRQLLYSTVLSGKTEREPRWKECVDRAVESLSLAAGALYIRKYFNEEARQNAAEMVSDIQAEFINSLTSVKWMDEDTRKNALEKAAAIVEHIGYPVELIDDKKLEDVYSNLEFTSDHYLKTILNLTLFGTQHSFRRLREPVNKTDWITHGQSAVVNALYSSTENSIEFPAAILQGAFFGHDRPKYMNYGAIGFAIGHEITHGFDDKGRQFDKDGNLADWWAENTKKAFIKKAQCIIDQYGNYTVPEINMNLNGINTQGENIADNGGIKVAYLAYNKWIERNGEEARLPGVNYTANQLFWISAANMWCGITRPESLKQNIVTDDHSTERFRVIGSFRNMEYFQYEFKCPCGSKMNQPEKCNVW